MRKNTHILVFLNLNHFASYWIPKESTIKLKKPRKTYYETDTSNQLKYILSWLTFVELMKEGSVVSSQLTIQSPSWIE